MERIDKWFITTGKEMIENKRKRLLELKNSDSEWWNSLWSDGARKQFGDNLIEKDGTIYPSGNLFDEHKCNVCGRIPPFDEKVIVMEFSFCEEYGCGMVICKECIKKFYKEINKKEGLK